jgi:hypothetical protein
MALATYSDLQTAVGEWLHRSDLATRIPDFIRLAETRMNSDVDARGQELVVNLTTTAGSEYVALPADLVEMRRLVLMANPERVLRYSTPDQINSDYPSGSTGQPASFTVAGGNLELYPIPDAVYTVELLYRQRIPALSNTNTTNWLLTQAPDVYLYGSLMAAAPYVQDDARMAVYEALYQKAVNQVNSIDWYSGSTLTVRPG